jgi:acyl carrier protein
MNKQEITDWLMSWFRERVPGLELGVNENYIDKGVIDSFGIIELIEAIETKFAVRFDQKDMQSLELFSVDGLAAIISRKL